MFTYLPGHTSIGVGPDNVVAVIESINAPNISVPEIGTEPTKAYLVGVATPNGGYGIFCYLLQLESNRPIVYISNPPEVPFQHYSALETDAIQFAESMGFMLDNMNFRAQPPQVRAQLIEQLPFFREPLPRGRSASTAGVGAASTDPAAIARLLASF